MQETEIKNILEKQRNFFRTGATLDVDFRLHALARLKACIRRHEEEISAALRKDLGKSACESYMCETGLTQSEISYMQRHTRLFAHDRPVPTPLSQFHSVSYVKPSPYGVVLIMSPWNYPFLLTMEPLVDALAAGNTAVLKPSAYAPHTGRVIERIIKECFPADYVTVVTGGREENTCLLQQHFDFLFFTGSKAVGREVMKSAAAHLTPVTLELGGKSPCLVERSADLELAAKRIVFGKYLNCGQTCVAPDYVYCDRLVKNELIAEILKQIEKQFGPSPLKNKDYGHIINQKHFDRICSLIDPDKIVAGGRTDAKSLRIEPTVLDNVTFEDAVMQEEIFGPVLPILTYDSLAGAVRQINSMEHPLALYLFTQNREVAKDVLSRCAFGGGCVNDTVIHLATSEMGFGGFGESGMGAYHGKEGFRNFTHYKSIVDKKTWIDLPMRYQPYRKVSDRLIHAFLR